MSVFDSLDPHRGTLNGITHARATADAATADLKGFCVAAVRAGVPVAQVARAAGVTRETIYDWKRAAK